MRHHRGINKQFPFTSLEHLLTSEEGFSLQTATPLQRAICRIIEGKPLGKLGLDPSVVGGLATDQDLPPGRPLEVIVLAAIRCAKSMIAAATALWASQTCELGYVTSGEVPRYPILSLQKDNAAVVLAHLRGALAKPAFQAIQFDREEYEAWKDIVMKDVSGGLVGSEVIRHPNGHAVEVRVVAGKRAGGSTISRWLFGVCFDEAPRMLGQDEGVVNYDDTLQAVLGRLLPGGQVLSIGSPWASFGPIFEAVQDHWGKPTTSRVIIKAAGPDMNPIWWTPERCEKLKKSNPTAYQTDVLAEFADVSETIFPQVLLTECSRENGDPIPYERGHEYVAAMDPATRGNAWTLVVADCVRRPVFRPGPNGPEETFSKEVKRVVFHAQWQGSPLQPLRPSEVIREINNVLTTYGLDWAYTDQWAADALCDIARGMGLNLLEEPWTAANKVDAFVGLANEMAEGLVEIPKDALFHKDLKLTKKKPTQAGVTIQFTKTSDKRHCDYAPTLAKAVSRWIQEDVDLDPMPGDADYNKWFEDKLEQEQVDSLDSQSGEQWWEFQPFH